MALKLEFSHPSGFVAPAAYAHIETFQGNKTSISAFVLIWKDAQAKQQKLQPIGQVQAKLNLQNGASYEAMYNELKTQAPFIGATNC